MMIALQGRAATGGPTGGGAAAARLFARQPASQFEPQQYDPQPRRCPCGVFAVGCKSGWAFAKMPVKALRTQALELCRLKHQVEKAKIETVWRCAGCRRVASPFQHRACQYQVRRIKTPRRRRGGAVVALASGFELPISSFQELGAHLEPTQVAHHIWGVQPVLAVVEQASQNPSEVPFPVILGASLILVTTVWLKPWFDTRLEFIERFRQLPGPQTPLQAISFPLGSLTDIFAMPKVPGTDNKTDVFGFFANFAQEYPGGYGLWVFHPFLPFARANFTIVEPQHAQRLLEADKSGVTVKGAVYRLVYPLIGSGILAAEGADWKRQRMAAEPGFKLEALELTVEVSKDLLLKRYFPSIEQSTRESAEEPGAYVDVYEYMLKMTLDVLGQVAFGCDFNGLASDGMYDAFETVITTLTVRTGQLPGSQYLPTEANRAYDAALKKLDSTVEDIVQARTLLEGETRTAEGADADASNAPEANDLLSALLVRDEQGNPVLTESEIVDNVKTFLFAGHDTTAAALAWAVYLLATHPEAAEKLYKEVSASVEAAGGPEEMHFRRLQQCSYLDAFIKELLRLYPSAGFTRTCLEDVAISDDITLPKGTDVFVFPYLVHRHPDNFENPEAFIPERWLRQQASFSELPESANMDGEGGYMNYYLPFSAGPRNCVGARVAAAEMKSILAQIVYRYKISLAPDTFTPRPLILLTLFPSPFKACFQVRSKSLAS